MEFDVFLLAAGFGSRMGEITKKIPKPLVKVNDKPLIAYNLEMIRRAGVRRVVVNAHYLAEMLENYLGSGSDFGLDIVVSREQEILGTGGGIKKALPFFETDTLLTLNSDSLFGEIFDFNRVVALHKETKADVTMVLTDHQKGFSAIGVDETNRIVKFLNAEIFGKKVLKSYLYTGAQVISGSMLEELKEQPEKFCIASTFHVHQISKGKFYQGFIYKGPWWDVGTPERLKQVENQI